MAPDAFDLRNAKTLLSRLGRKGVEGVAEYGGENGE